MRDEVTPGVAIGLDPGVRACLFDLDGVITRTAEVHAEAWKKTFDTFLRAHETHTLRRYAPFDERADYEQYLDGRTRADGIRAFLASRGIELPEGDSADPPGTETVHGIGAAKQWAFLSLLETSGPQVREGSVRYVRAARAAGLPCALVTLSSNADAVVAAAGMETLFDLRIDGRVAAALRLLGKPARDGYLAAARGLEVEPARAAVFDYSLAGVDAAAAGGFGTIVCLDRTGGEHRALLRSHGATVVVRDLSELLMQRGTAKATQAAARTSAGLEG